MKIKNVGLMLIIASILVSCSQYLTADTLLRSIEKEFIRIVNNASPSIVEISATKHNPIKRLQFRALREKVGTGIIIDEEGYIVTTESVVGGSNKIEVTLFDGKNFDAKIVGVDPATDIALIKIGAENLPVASLGNSDSISSGSWVLTIGRSYGEAPTLSFGIVNGTESPPDRPAYYDAIRINANVSPGNSGGGVIDMDGKLVGIIIAAIAEPRTIDFFEPFFESLEDISKDEVRSQGRDTYWSVLRKDDGSLVRGSFLGVREEIFAIPINFAKKIVDDLIEYGEVERGWLGVFIQPVRREDIKRLGLDTEAGAIITEVAKNSPASKAGIQKDDVIIDFNRKKIRNTADLVRAVATTKPHTKADLTIIRDKQRQTLNVEVGKMSKNS